MIMSSKPIGKLHKTFDGARGVDLERPTNVLGYPHAGTRECLLRNIDRSFSYFAVSGGRNSTHVQ